MGDTPLLQVRGLTTTFATDDGIVTAVDDVSFSVGRGETLGIVGESGCGKSVTSLSIMRLLPEETGRIAAGSIDLEGVELTRLSEDEMRRIRGNRISMVFQEPMTSLNPVYTVGDQVAEAILSHSEMTTKEARRVSIEMLQRVGIPSPEERIDSYPFQLSGGMRQRVMIAMAMACDPDVLIADEPTTALDVTIQAQILELMVETQRTSKTAIIFITHDLGVIAETADRVVVMYAGQIIESAAVSDIFGRPHHPYTQGLLRSVPAIDRNQETLDAIPGVVPSPSAMPQGCRFHPRCPHARQLCRRICPTLVAVADDHEARCFRDTPEWEASDA